MIVVNIHEAKARLSEYLDAVANGERVLICKRNQPVAELRAVERKRTEPRTLGPGPYHFEVPASFFEPMPDQFLDTFEAGPVYPDPRPAPSGARGPGHKGAATRKDARAPERTNRRKHRKKP